MASYFFDLSKLMCGGVVIGGLSPLFIGVGIGGLSPLITGKEMTTFNYICAAIGSLAAIVFAYCANRIMKYNDKY